MNETVKLDYVKELFGLKSDPNEYDIETAKLLDSAAFIFEFYRESAGADNFMNPDEIQIQLRKLTAIVAILNVRLGYYDAQDLKTYWTKNLTRVTKRGELYKNKIKDKLTEQMIQTMADESGDYQIAVERHLCAADFANRLKLTVQAARIMLESLRGEIINHQVERKYSQHQT